MKYTTCRTRRRKAYNPGFNQFMKHFWGPELGNFMGVDFQQTVPAVNIIEDEGAFVVEVAAPGFSKNDFKVYVENNHLVIKGEKEIAGEGENDKTAHYRRREFNYSTFERVFKLPKTINIPSISAGYSRGILTVTIPTVEETEDPNFNIEIL